MTDRLFKFGSLEDEIMKSMETSLVKYQKDQLFGHEKLAKAVDHLSAAAEIFDDTGFSKEAEFVTRLIEKIAHGEAGIGKMIEESLPEHSKSPLNKLLEEEMSKKDIEELLNKGNTGPDEPFRKSPSAMPPPLDISEEHGMPPEFEDPLTEDDFAGLFGDMKSDKMEQRRASDKKKV